MEVFLYVIYLIIAHTFPTRLVSPSLLPCAATIAHFLLVGVILEKGDVGVVWQEDWPRGMRTAMLGFSAPVSKKHRVSVCGQSGITLSALHAALVHVPLSL